MKNTRPWAVLWFGIIALQGNCSAEDIDGRTATRGSTLLVRPSDTDPLIRRFDAPHYVIANDGQPRFAQLVVFLPGTHGVPMNVVHLLNVVAAQGYRVIGLEYDNTPAVSEVCQTDPEPSCSADFRRKRIFGDHVSSVISDTPEESIVHRLVSLLIYLRAHFPDSHWGDYLQGADPRWNQIVVAGLSQGAGMAAYIGKHVGVARVVLFSGPWDVTRSGELAQWLTGTGETPADKWFAAYHRSENTATLIAAAYQALGVPAEHIFVFTGKLPRDESRRNVINPFHTATVRQTLYEPQWRRLFGSSP